MRLREGWATAVAAHELKEGREAVIARDAEGAILVMRAVREVYGGTVHVGPTRAYRRKCPHSRLRLHASLSPRQ